MATARRFGSHKGSAVEKLMQGPTDTGMAYAGHFDSFLLGSDTTLHDGMLVDELATELASTIERFCPLPFTFSVLVGGWLNHEGQLYNLDSNCQLVGTKTMCIGYNSHITNVYLKAALVPSMIVDHGICIAIEALKLASGVGDFGIADIDVAIVDSMGYRLVPKPELELYLHHLNVTDSLPTFN
ncbi:hypothetical protein KR093_008133 [Drosophila rubida]|uniref:Uncharacterized protein n=1 Tax=Drosophila rubida TaxID=30044 RepID=A0AAD4KE62_9MUSC|nr:hypothetical protein KR093_008133 [Drosophila rubida]